MDYPGILLFIGAAVVIRVLIVNFGPPPAPAEV